VTDLPGPNTLEETLEQRLAAGESFAFLFIEIEGFERLVVDEGWIRGEKLASDAAVALRGVTPPTVTLTHLGGGDFALMVGLDEAGALADAVSASLAGCVTAAGLTTKLTRVDSGELRSVEELAHEVARKHHKA
jgi:predicted signal transduction protein with EAL and GGDEF domain